MKKRKSCLFVISLIIILSLVSINISAHEVFVNNGSPVSLSFQTQNSSGGPLIKVYYYHLQDNGAPSSYHNIAPIANSSWNYVGQSGVYVVNGYQSQSTASGSNVRMYVNPTSFANYGGTSSTVAITILYDTNYHSITGPSSAASSNGIIKYANIYMNHNDDILWIYNATQSEYNDRVLMSLVHEVGHAIGLGHSNRSSYDPISLSTYSVMRYGTFPDIGNTGTAPQNHERQDIYAKYH